MSTVAVSLDDYLSTVYEPDCEWVDGHLVERNVGEKSHSGIQGLLIAWFWMHGEALGLIPFPELRVRLSPHHYRIPDLTVVTGDFEGGILTTPPLVCIEILSPEDRTAPTQPKLIEYIRFGVPHVWLIDPLAKSAWIYDGERLVESSETLPLPEFPIHVPLAELFAKLERTLGRK